ncbi:uncharacterized protein [Dysidea avara]|uniref:uncharacterized protein isoform X2 n=1 Tax=Dysidea avara TaxID=196820 RepID=UPI0033337824
MSKKVYSDVPWQGLLTDERQHDDPVLSQKCLEETALVCSRISNHSGYARLTRYYNILYQSFMPNCKLSVEVLRRHYHISSEVISFICSGRTVRICNQRVLTFLLTEFEKDHDISKFFSIVKQLIQLPDLRMMIDRLRDEFPAETDKDIQATVIVDENTEVVDEDQDMKIQFEASDLPSYSAVDEDVTVLEIKEFQAEITVRRVRTSIVSDSHTLSDSPTIDTSPVLHKTKHLYTPPVTSQSVFTVTLNDTTHHTMPNLEGNTSHTVSTPSHQPVLLSPQLSGAEETDVFSEEVKSKPHTLSHDHNTSFEGSYSSEASTPAKSPPQFSSSPFSPSRDHSSLTSYSENLYPTGPLSDKSLLQATATTASVSSKASAKPSVSAAASVMGPAVDPVTLLEEKGFEPLKSRYSLLYQSFPENYMHTVSKLEQHLTDTDITSILGCTKTILANKKILDSLIVHMKCREDLLDLCDHLEKISESPSMSNIVNELRNDVINNIQKEPHPKSHSKMDDEPDPPVFSRIEAIDPNCKVVQILKKYYHTLCHSLSPNIIKNLSAVAGICATDSRFRSQIEKCQTPVQANRILLDRLILSLDFEERMLEFCDVLDNMIEDGELKQNLEMFRNEILAVLSNKPEGSTDWRIKPVTFLKVQTPEGVKTVCIKDPHQQHMYAADGTTTKSVMAVSHCPHCHHHHHHSHDVTETDSGDDVLQPPPIPQYNVSRLKLEKELTDAVLDSSQAKSAVAVTIVGDGGFGKSTLAKAFCHSTTTKQYFPDGFLIVELGPNAPDPRSTLRRLYRRLSCGLRIDGDVNSIAQYIHTLIIENYPSILVIIDDVCNLHDAQPYIMAFRNCKIIVTTKLGDVCQQLSSSKVVIVGQMEPLEATKLLSSATGQLSEDDEMIVRELANDLHFWPLLLCIARGQLQMNFKKAGVHAIGNLQSDLYGKGLEHVTRASDENDSHSRKTALTACVEASLELLTPEENDSLLNLVHHIGGGGVIETQHVPKLCNIDEVSSIQLLDKLNSLGLITFTLSSGNAKEAIKIHNVIAQYLLDSQVYNPPEHLGDSQEAKAFMNPAEEGQTVSILLFSRRNPQNTADKITGTPEWCLNNVLQTYDNQFDSFIKINEHHIGSWSTDIFNLLQNVCSVAYTSPAKFPDLKSIESEADRLLTECQSVMMEYSQEINQLKQQVDTMVKQRDYDGALKKLEEYFINFSLKQVALGTKKLVERVASGCDQKYKHSLEVSSEFLHCFTPEHDFFLKLQLPSIKLILDLHRRIIAALASGPPAVDEVADEIWTSKLSDQSSLLNANYMIKLQEVAPHQVLQWQQINSF